MATPSTPPTRPSRPFKPYKRSSLSISSSSSRSSDEETSDERGTVEQGRAREGSYASSQGSEETSSWVGVNMSPASSKSSTSTSASGSGSGSVSASTSSWTVCSEDEPEPVFVCPIPEELTFRSPFTAPSGSSANNGAPLGQRGGFVFGNGMVSTKRDERKALGLRAAVGSYKRRSERSSSSSFLWFCAEGRIVAASANESMIKASLATLSSSPDSASPDRPPRAQTLPSDFSTLPLPLQVPRITTTSPSPPSPSRTNSASPPHRTSAATAAAAGETEREDRPDLVSLRRRPTAILRAAHHRRVVSDCGSPKGLVFGGVGGVEGGRGKGGPTTWSMPSLDQIQQWAAQRKATLPSSIPDPQDGQDGRSQQPVKRHRRGSASAPAESMLLAIEGTARLPAHSSILRPPLIPLDTETSFGDDDEDRRTTTEDEDERDGSDTPSTPDDDVYAPHDQDDHDDLKSAKTDKAEARPPPPRIQVHPAAAALQEGQDALAFAKAVLSSPSPPASPRPTVRSPSIAEEDVDKSERRRDLFRHLAQAQKRRTASGATGTGTGAGVGMGMGMESCAPPPRRATQVVSS